MSLLREALRETIAPHLPHGAGSGKAARERGEAELSPRAWSRIGAQIQTLHEAYTRRDAAFRQQANPIHAAMAGYQFYFLPRNFYRAYRVLAELPWREPAGAAAISAWCEGGTGPLRVLDLGCGTGAFSLAVLSLFAGKAGEGAPALPGLRYTLVDQGHGLLALAEANLRAFAARVLPGVPLEIELRADGVEGFMARPPTGERYAVAGAAMMLNELGLLGPRRVSRRAAHLADVLGRVVRPGGLALFVEAGTRKGYMNLMAVREHLRERPILYPCPHGEACPLWEPRVRHWCHASVALPADFFFDAALRRRARVDFEMKTLNLAGLAVQIGAGARPQAPFRERAGRRIVSGRLPGGGGVEKAGEAGKVVLVCSPDGRLHEEPAQGLGRLPRGEWMPSGASPAQRR